MMSTALILSTIVDSEELTSLEGRDLALLRGDLTTVRQNSSSQSYLDRLLSLVGLDASRIARWLAQMGDPAYRIANLREQSCRVRLACDLGSGIYNRVGYLQNLMVRGTVRMLLSRDSAYYRPWTAGMVGQNCTFKYPECSSWQLEAMGDLFFPSPALTSTTHRPTYT